MNSEGQLASPQGTAGLAAAVEAAAHEIDSDPGAHGRGIGLLRDYGVLGLPVPAEFGGQGGGAAEVLAVAEELGGLCLGLAVVWVMHCQQVAVIDGYAQ